MRFAVDVPIEFGKNQLKQLTRILKKDPNGCEANLQMGRFYPNQENIVAAIPRMEKAASKSEDAELFYSGQCPQHPQLTVEYGGCGQMERNEHDCCICKYL